MKLYAMLFLAAGLVSSQTTGKRYSATTGNVTLSGAGTSLTIQQPATNGNTITLEGATVYCSVACTVSQSRNGTAATATLLNQTISGTLATGSAGVSSIPPTQPQTPSAALIYNASNVGTGISVGPPIVVNIGTVQIDLSKVGLNTGSTANNYTISVSSISGTANITLIWSERFPQ